MRVHISSHTLPWQPVQKLENKGRKGGISYQTQRYTTTHSCIVLAVEYCSPNPHEHFPHIFLAQRPLTTFEFISHASTHVLQTKSEHPFLVGWHQAFLRHNRFFHCLPLLTTHVFPLFRFIFKSTNAPLLPLERHRNNDLVKPQQKTHHHQTTPKKKMEKHA